MVTRRGSHGSGEMCDIVIGESAGTLSICAIIEFDIHVQQTFPDSSRGWCSRHCSLPEKQ